MSTEVWFTASCRQCEETSLSSAEGRLAGVCPFCGATDGVTFGTQPVLNRNVAAQEATVAALWELGKCGPPTDDRGYVRPEFTAAAGVALGKIMAAFGVEVTPIQ